MIEFGSPYYKKDNDYYCGDCAFINGFIDAKLLINDFYYFINIDDIGTPIVKDNKVIFVSNSYINAKQNKDFRKTPEYIRWRSEIYERDNYTCQMCHKKGGKLNAHHLKPFSKYTELRTDVNNGITLCEDCHKLLHKKREKNARLD